MAGGAVTTSVVVATLGRSATLDACLAALAADGADEVLVVDNAPSATTREVADRHGARWLPEPRPGKSHALNTGVAAAAGDAVLFTDDDVLVGPGWCTALAAALGEPGVGAAGGRVVARWPAPPPAWVLGPHAVHLTLVDHGPEPRRLDPPRFPYGAALAVRADVLGRLDPPFEPSLGPRPGLKLGHEEVRLAERVRALGLAVVHAPDAVAEHCVDPARMSRKWLRRTAFATGVGSARRERLGGAPVAPLPRRLAELAVSAGRAARWSGGPLTAERVDRETGAWAACGQRLERVTGRSARRTDALAARLAGGR